MQRFIDRVSCLLLVALLAWQSSAQADSSLLILENPQRRSFTGFASSLAAVGDIDGDGAVDYLVGAYEYRGGQNMKPGRAFVLSGRSGQPLLTLDLPQPPRGADVYGGSAFGRAVAAAGDLDRDGTPDVLIGAFGQEGSGRAFVFSGKTGKLLYTLQPLQPQLSGGFEWSVASLRDLTGDRIRGSQIARAPTPTRSGGSLGL